MTDSESILTTEISNKIEVKSSVVITWMDLVLGHITSYTEESPKFKSCLIKIPTSDAYAASKHFQ